MKKFITALLTITMLASLAGCTENSENDTNSPDISNSSDSGNNSGENSEPAQSTPKKDKGEPTFITGLDGKPIYSNEITTVLNSGNEETTIDKITAENFCQAVCDGMCFLSEPSGISRTQYDNPDSWEGSSPQCLDEPTETLRPEYKRFNVGDTFCGLTIKKATTEFNHNFQDNFESCTVEFDGELTLTGYFRVYPGDDYTAGEGDMQFIIDDKSAILPGNPDTSENFFIPGAHTVFRHTGFHLDNGTDKPDWYWSCNEYGQIYLGNVRDCTIDLSEVGRADDRYECYNKVKIKIGDLRIGSCHEMSDLSYSYSANLIELEVIDT